MELAMNSVDYYMGGMNVASIFNSTFWIAFTYAFVAGYLAALPVNYIMISLNNQNKIRFNTEMRIKFIEERFYLYKAIGKFKRSSCVIVILSLQCHALDFQKN